MDLTVRRENLTSGSQEWLGSAHGTNAGRTVTLDKSAFTSGTHYPDGYLRSGTPLGVITATQKYGPYDEAAVDGRTVLRGFLLTDVQVPAEDIDPQGVLFEHGVVIAAKLPIAVDANGQTDVAGRIIFR